ncbi:hypothetical protein B5F98_11980 [Pseudoflavonifractor sp. An44]|uniref:DUF6465 family protein n=1 Tax=Pseudoflavonifractor sp. An44 TaxID=1965635 RepID=UPI000B3AB76C|nr:DUF6465 family protein [Pseudoflavonifractor sp. An44]OUN91509.1 hypothetical protein B5F98_11980 [Pseudoflavonifractor sp. An44]
MARVTAAQKKTVTEPKVEASLEKKVVEQPVKKTTRAAAPKKVELAYVQFAGKEWDMAEVVKKAKEDYLAQGNKATSMKKFCVYVKPEEGLAYYVVNDTETGSVEL